MNIITAPKKRGRPPKNKAVIPDEVILNNIKERFNILSLLTEATIDGTVRSLTVTGAPGVGKSYTVERILENSTNKFEVVRGGLSPVNLYMLGHRNKDRGNVILIDDCDSIFNDEEALNLLKAMCDSSQVRTVSWLKQSPALIAQAIPTSYQFEGSVIFISNLNFQSFIDAGKNKYAQHMSAIISRSMYLDLHLHNKNDLSVWVTYIAEAGKIFDTEEVPYALRQPIMDFIKSNRMGLRELSIRTLLKTCQLAKSNPLNWQSMAKILLTKQEV
jgi:GTPase SAR1 family protein